MKYVTIDSGLKVGKIQGPEGWRPCIQHIESGIIIVLSDENLKAALEKEFNECAERNG